MGEAEVVSLWHASVIRESRITGPRTGNPPEIPDSCLPASSREFAPLCTDQKRLTEDPVLLSTIRHHFIVRIVPEGATEPHKN